MLKDKLIPIYITREKMKEKRNFKPIAMKIKYFKYKNKLYKKVKEASSSCMIVCKLFDEKCAKDVAFILNNENLIIACEILSDTQFVEITDEKEKLKILTSKVYKTIEYYKI